MLRFKITVNSVRGDRHDGDMSDALYAVLEAQGFHRLERWSSGSLSAWQSDDGNAIDWTTTFAVIRALQAECDITTETIV